MTNARRYDLDWLRIIAFAILVYFHAAIVFVPGGLPLIQNHETSPVLEWLVDFLHQFRLALLFLVSGVGVGFSLKRRSRLRFVAERSVRLLIPLLVGIVFIVPPMVYAEKVFLGAFSGTFFEFYGCVFSSGVYPEGNLSWHHLWFVLYLYLFCLLGLPWFLRLADRTDQLTIRLLDLFSTGASRLGVYAFVIPLFVVELALRWAFPGFRDLIHDWASFFHWFLIFLAGYMVANHQFLLARITRLRYVSLALAALSTGLLFAGFYGAEGLRLNPDDDRIFIKYILYCAIRMTLVWSCLLTCLGFASHYLRFSNRVLTYLNEAVYPLFILHLTVTIVLSYFVVSWDLNLWAKYLLVTTATIFIILALYHCLIRPWNMMRWLFGVKARTSSDQA